MAARTALTPITLNNDTGTAQGSGTAIAGLVSAGATVPSPGPYKALVVVNNSGASAANVTIRASRSGVDASGNAQSNSMSNTVFTAATTGDLTVSVAAAATVFIPVTNTDRFTQDDGSMSIDFAAGMTGTIWVLRGSYVIPS